MFYINFEDILLLQSALFEHRIRNGIIKMASGNVIVSECFIWTLSWHDKSVWISKIQNVLIFVNAISVLSI